jgi:hypothetical protein
MQYEEGLATLESRARLAKAALWLFVAVAAVTGAGEVMETTGIVDTATGTDPLTFAVGLTYLGFTAVFLACVVLVCRWIHRAHANLHDAGIDGLEFTPGWAVGWYFVPIANLFKPFGAMRELWTASHAEVDKFGGEAPSEVKWWWGAWISGNILSSVSSRILLMGEGETSALTLGNALGAVSTALILFTAVLLVKLIDGITSAQRGGVTAATVFA